MDNEEIKPLLVKYITGEADQTDLEQVKEWINAHPENEQYFAQLYETWHNMLYLQPQMSKENTLPVKVLFLRCPSLISQKTIEKRDTPKRVENIYGFCMI